MLKVKVHTSKEWFEMKGPEIRFPITVQRVNLKTRKQQLKERPMIMHTEPDRVGPGEASKQDNISFFSQAIEF